METEKERMEECMSVRECACVCVWVWAWVWVCVWTFVWVCECVTMCVSVWVSVWLQVRESLELFPWIVKNVENVSRHLFTFISSLQHDISKSEFCPQGSERWYFKLARMKSRRFRKISAGMNLFEASTEEVFLLPTQQPRVLIPP